MIDVKAKLFTSLTVINVAYASDPWKMLAVEDGLTGIGVGIGGLTLFQCAKQILLVCGLSSGYDAGFTNNSDLICKIPQDWLKFNYK